MTEKRSVYTGPLVFGNIQIPIAIYVGLDEFGLEGHLYHDGCNGKIRERRFCELHPEDDEVVSFSGMEIGDEIIPISSEVRNGLLDRKAPFQVVGSYPLSRLPELMSSSQIVPLCLYEVAPQLPDSPVSKVYHSKLKTLFERMRVKKVFLLCSIGLAGMRRFAILLPGGQLYPLAYREEIRNPVIWNGFLDKQLAAEIDKKLAVRRAFPKFSLEAYQTRIQDWAWKILAPQLKPRRGTKKKLAEKQKVGA